MSIDKEAKSPQVGINTSVSNIGLPKSKVTNLLAPRGKTQDCLKCQCVLTSEEMLLVKQ